MKKIFFLITLFFVIVGLYGQTRTEHRWMIGRWQANDGTVMILNDNGTGSFISSDETLNFFFSIGPPSALIPGSNGSIIMFFEGERLRNEGGFPFFRINDQRMVIMELDFRKQ